MSSLENLIAAMVSYLQSAGTSVKELARRVNVPPERLSASNPRLSPTQMTRMWLLVQERMRASAGFSQKVQDLINIHLESGCARAAVIASQLNMSRQTLYQRLKRENQSFAALLDRARRERALAYLQNPDHTLTDVAQRLGFSELSAFSRAFKRWMGQSPAHYRSSRITAS